MWLHLNPINRKRKESVHPNVTQTHPTGRNRECKGLILAGTGTSGKHFLKQEKEAPPLRCALCSQSISMMEAGTLLVAPDCGRMGTVGSLAGRWCRRMAQVGTGWCDRWPGPGTPGQILGLLGDTSRRQSRPEVPERKKNIKMQMNRHYLY